MVWMPSAATVRFARTLIVTTALLAVVGGPARAQKVITVPVAVRRTWDDIVQRDALQPERAANRAVPYMPAPAPYEVGGAPPIPPPSPTTPDATTEALAPSQPLKVTRDFAALPDNQKSIPPDTMGAAGPNHLMTMLNTQVRIQGKDGTAVGGPVSLTSFWTDGVNMTGDPFDPKIVYDAIHGRWIATCDANSKSATSKVFFAITDTRDPTGTWTFYWTQADSTGATWADFPGMGVNMTWIAITNNMYPVPKGAFVGAKMWVIEEGTALAAASLTVTVFPTGFDKVEGIRHRAFALKPCVTFGPEPKLYLVDTSLAYHGKNAMLQMSQLTGTTSPPHWSGTPGSIFPGTGLFYAKHIFRYGQINASQSGTATRVDSGDARISGTCVFRNGSIWCTHSGGLPVAAVDRTAVFWYQLDPDSMVASGAPIVQSGVLDGGVEVHYLYPSIAVNDRNDVCLGFSRSHAGIFVEAAYTSRFADDPLGKMAPVAAFKPGKDSYVKMSKKKKVRWGDYSTTTIDPTDDRTFWTLQEYAETDVGSRTVDDRWGTWWGMLPPPEACCFSDDTCEDLQEAVCRARGGASQGPDTDCTTMDCASSSPTDRVLGACCGFPCRECSVMSRNACEQTLGELFLGGACPGEFCMAQDVLCCQPSGTCEPVVSERCCDDLGGFLINDCSSCPPPPPQACCFEDETCQDLTAADCAAQGGQLQGAGTDCATTNCPPPPPGACCFTDGTCQVLTVATCAVQGGQSAGRLTNCGAVTCTEACCFPNGNCQDRSRDDCEALGGTPQGFMTDCATTDCPPPPQQPEACCLGDGTCENLLPDDCQVQGGQLQGPGTDCATTNCPQSEACCEPNGACKDLVPDVCKQGGGHLPRGGEPQGPGTTCATTHCPQPEACCFQNEFCMVLLPSLCTLEGGLAQGPGTHCALVSCAAALIYVDAHALGADDGTSWTDAFVDLQDGLAAAASLGGFVEIWVADGTYRPSDLTEVGDPRTATFALLTNVAVYGGFAGADSVEFPGGETARDQRSPARNITTLSGDLGDDDGPNFTGTGDNAYHVVTASGTTRTAVLDGFVITAGNNEGVVFPHDRGAGIFNDGGSPTVANCTLIRNAARSDGGGMHDTNGSPRLISCTFLGNRAIGPGEGAGFHTSNGSPELINCVFSGNFTNVRGGGMSNVGGSPVVTNCTFSGNVATIFGGGVFTDGGALTVINSIFWGNGDAGGTDESAQIQVQTGAPVVNYSCVQGGWSGAGNPLTNINLDPQFVRDPDDGGDGWGVGSNDDFGDLHLRPGSPCIDRADNTAVPSDVITDVDQAARFVDIPGVPDLGNGTPPIVDMGAYEATLVSAAIPAVSAWGLGGLMLLTLLPATILIRWRRRQLVADHLPR